jgi:hypothetical protein
MPQKLSNTLSMQNTELLAPPTSFEITSAAGTSPKMDIDTGNAISDSEDVISDPATTFKSGILFFFILYNLLTHYFYSTSKQSYFTDIQHHI